jgi:hypothetical protein
MTVLTHTSLVYGLALEHLPTAAAELCGARGSAAPVVSVEIHPDSPYEAEIDVYVDDDRATLRMTEGWVEIVRNPRAIRYHVSRPLTAEMLVHPYLAFPAAVVNHWLGRVALHAGCIVVDDAAIAILGTKGAGKSSTMAAAARAGYEVLAEDLLIVDGGEAMAGPRAIDLRADAAAEFGGRYLGVVGARERWRIALPPALVSSAPLRAVVILSWGDPIAARPLAMAERVGPILASCALGDGWIAPGAALELFDTPAWEIVRPRDLGRIDDVVELIASLAPGGSGRARHEVSASTTMTGL